MSDAAMHRTLMRYCRTVYSCTRPEVVNIWHACTHCVYTVHTVCTLQRVHTPAAAARCTRSRFADFLCVHCVHYVHCVHQQLYISRFLLARLLRVYAVCTLSAPCCVYTVYTFKHTECAHSVH
jgi:hypothetical protein